MVGFYYLTREASLSNLEYQSRRQRPPSTFPHRDEPRRVQFKFLCSHLRPGWTQESSCASANSVVSSWICLLCCAVLCGSHAEEACGHRGPHAHRHLEWSGLLQIDAGRGRQRAAEHQPALLQALPEHHQQPAATGAAGFDSNGPKMKWKIIIKKRQKWIWLNFGTALSGPPGYFTNGAELLVQL